MVSCFQAAGYSVTGGRWRRSQVRIIMMGDLWLRSVRPHTCAGTCGQVRDTCSCHDTCVSLLTCCADYRQFCLQVSPQSGTVFGGTDFMVLNATFDSNSMVTCSVPSINDTYGFYARFNEGIVTEGYVDEEGRGHCISPLLYETGWIRFHISTDGGVTYSREGMWQSGWQLKPQSSHSKNTSAVGPLSKALNPTLLPGGIGPWPAQSIVNPRFKASLDNSTKWQYYGTPNVGGGLKMTWNTSHVRAERVNLELWGYRETGEPYSGSWQGEWTYLYSLQKDLPNSGEFSFIPKPAEKPFSDWELGCVRVSSSAHPDGKRNVHAVWTEDHALAWHLEARFRQDSASWARGKCLDWDRLERRLPNFLNETIDCPCTLAQARADTGRFHTDYGCDIEKGSVCTYHPGSVHCVRAIQARMHWAMPINLPQKLALQGHSESQPPKPIIIDGFMNEPITGQQCCYDSTGAQVLTADSIGGSTPDRGHDWGSPPYRRPPRVPGASHWIYDVLSFYYCCLWSDNCHYYFIHRPSSDCRTYSPPKAGEGAPPSGLLPLSLPWPALAVVSVSVWSQTTDSQTLGDLRICVVFGDPHFITFDGTSYTFNGKGEYCLLESPQKGLTIQGRTEPVRLENGTEVKAARLSAVAMKEQSSDVIEVRLIGRLDHLEVLRNQQVSQSDGLNPTFASGNGISCHSLYSTSAADLLTQRPLGGEEPSPSVCLWLSFDSSGVFVFSPIPQNVTVMFPSGVGVEVRGAAGSMATTVLLPEDFKGLTRGLLGQMNNDPQDDLMTQNGTVLPPDQSSAQDLFVFGADWAITNETSLFTYDNELLLNTFYFGPKHHPSFLPVFSFPESPGDQLQEQTKRMCAGEGSAFCTFDSLATRSLQTGNTTRTSFLSHSTLVDSLQPVVSCGWLRPPSNGKKQGTRYLQGAVVSFSCNSGYVLAGAGKRTCQADGHWSGDPAQCVTGMQRSQLGALSRRKPHHLHANFSTLFKHNAQTRPESTHPRVWRGNSVAMHRKTQVREGRLCGGKELDLNLQTLWPSRTGVKPADTAALQDWSLTCRHCSPPGLEFNLQTLQPSRTGV
ncbi:hypothetical protein JZ751_005763 [Albula glossodonta]|uniref:Sushi domain containing 2 n=1 Tax=Albula glossodonta TaxID=121402 RepID=A0A8T2NF50_9TELE|nr:hypothetical protein JZ751_005763 [Albula glossodonta]